MGIIIDLIRAVRNLRSEIGLQSQKVNAYIISSGQTARLVENNAMAIKTLARIEELTIQEQSPSDKGQCLAAHLPGMDVLVPVSGLIDIEVELARVKSEITSIEKELTRVKGKLNNEQYLTKAPANVIEKDRRIESELSEKMEKLQERLKMLS